MTDSDNMSSSVRTTASNRRTFLTTLGAAGVVGLAGCAGSDGGDGDGGDDGGETGNGGGSGSAEVHFITEESAPAAKEFINSAIADFTEETGIPVTPEYTGLGSGLGQRVSTLLQTGNAPEVVLTGGFEATDWVRQDIVADMSETVSAIESEWTEYQDRHRLVIEGTDYLVPIHMNTAAQTYRADLFEQAGISPPLTFQEERERFPQLADSLPENMSVTNMSLNAGLVGHASTEMRMETNGIEWLAHSGDEPFTGFEVVLDEGNNRERMIQSLEHIREIAEYSLNPNLGVSDWAPAYYTGKTAIGEFGGFRPLTGAYRESPEIASNSQSKRLAHGPNVEDPTYHTFLEGLTVMKDAEHPDAGRQFVEYMMSGDRLFGMLLSFSPIHNIPTLDAVFDDDRYRNSDYMEENNVSDDFLDFVRDEIKPRGLPRFRLPGTPCPYIGSVQSTFALGKMSNDVINGADPGPAVDEAASTLREALTDVQE